MFQSLTQISTYSVGDTATVTFSVMLPGTPPLTYPPAAVPPTYVDPGAITVAVALLPAGGALPVVTLYTLTYGTDAALARLGVGLYQVTIPVTAAGTWCVRWRSTANVQQQGQGVVEWRFEAQASAFQTPN